MNLKDKIKNIARYEYMNFMKDPNVVGVGCGNKYVNNIDIGKLCIRVYVREKYKKGYNATVYVPKYYLGIPTDVIESGEFIAYSGFDEKIRPVKMGYSIVPKVENLEYGTVGCIVKRTNTSGNLDFFILSCNHLIADENKLPIGTPVIQPGNSRVIEDSIAKLSEFVPLKFITPTSQPENIVDAAIAKINDINLVRPQIAFMRIPKGADFFVLENDFVKKSGAVTGYTTGKIFDEGASFKITYTDGNKAFFIDQIVANIESDEGDSGAMVLNKDNNIIGMITSGSGKSNYIVINKIEHILVIFNVSLHV